MAKVKKPIKSSQFPQIIRKIPASRTKLTSSRGLQPRVGGAFLRDRLPSWRLLVTVLIVSILLLQLIQLAHTIYSNYHAAALKQAEKQALEEQLAEWEKIAQLRPNYRDAYFELAVLSYRLNNIDKAKLYLAKVFELDPNFEPARKLEKILK